MRPAFAVLLLAALPGLGMEEPTKPGLRHGVAPDLKPYPQASAKETLVSVLKAVEAGRFDYLVAQLADPAWVDERIERLYGGRFAEQVEDTRHRLDPSTVKVLRRFLAEGEWATEKDHASVRLKDVADRGVFFVHKGDRWYLEHRSKPAS
jgi:hypothetical protein